MHVQTTVHLHTRLPNKRVKGRVFSLYFVQKRIRGLPV
jgi:hypothetical protein